MIRCASIVVVLGITLAPATLLASWLSHVLIGHLPRLDAEFPHYLVGRMSLYLLPELLALLFSSALTFSIHRMGHFERLFRTRNTVLVIGAIVCAGGALVPVGAIEWQRVRLLHYLFDMWRIEALVARGEYEAALGTVEDSARRIHAGSQREYLQRLAQRLKNYPFTFAVLARIYGSEQPEKPGIGEIARKAEVAFLTGDQSVREGKWSGAPLAVAEMSHILPHDAMLAVAMACYYAHSWQDKLKELDWLFEYWSTLGARGRAVPMQPPLRIASGAPDPRWLECETNARASTVVRAKVEERHGLALAAAEKDRKVHGAERVMALRRSLKKQSPPLADSIKPPPPLIEKKREGAWFFVVLASYTSKAGADQELRRVTAILTQRKVAMKAEVKMMEVPAKGKRYRVTLGEFPEMAAARDFCEKFAKREGWRDCFAQGP